MEENTRQTEGGRQTAPSSLPVSLSPCLLVFLVGPRGSGKTTVARLLAGRLGWGWVDADEVLEARAGRSIRAIFEQEGEAGFRAREAAVLEELARGERQVVATGGGVVLREANRARMRRAGRVVWLTADAATLWRRMQDDATTAQRRPALTVGGQEEVEEVLRARASLYAACAHAAVSTEGHTPEEVAASLFDQLVSLKTLRTDDQTPRGQGR